MGGRGSSSKIKTNRKTNGVETEYTPPVELEPEELPIPERLLSEESTELSPDEALAGSRIISYDIEDRAAELGFASAEDMINFDMSEISFSTVKQDLIDEIEEYDYSVIGDTGEAFVITDDRDETDSEFLVYYDHTGSTWALSGRVRKS